MQPFFSRWTLCVCLLLPLTSLWAQSLSRSGQAAAQEPKPQGRNVGCGGELLFSEEFDGSAGLPAGWTVVDGDGAAPNTNIEFITPQGGWQIIADLKDSTNGNLSIASPSWYTEDNVPSDDWLILPETQVLPGGACFSFLAYAQDASYTESFEVYASTSGGTPADFLTTTPLLTITDETSEFTNYTIDLSDFSGQSVFLAVRHTSENAFILVLDDFRLADVENRDLAVFSFELQDDAQPNVDYPIRGVLVNRGLDTLTFDTADIAVGYRVDGETFIDPIDAAFTLAPNDTFSFVHDSTWRPTEQRLYDVTLFIESIASDANLSNDTLRVSVPVGVTVGLPQAYDPDAWQISPNPAKERLFIRFSVPTAQMGTLQLFDMTGKLVNSSIQVPAGSRTWQMSLTGIPAGLYWLRYIDETGRRLQSQLWVE